MIHIAARDRYEVNGKTILFLHKERISHEDLEAIRSGERFTWSAKNENIGNKEEGVFTIRISRNICKLLSIEQKGNGLYLTVCLDIEYLPITQRLLDRPSF